MTPRPSWSARCKLCSTWTKRLMPEPTQLWHRARKLAVTERPARRYRLSPRWRIIWRSARQTGCQHLDMYLMVVREAAGLLHDRPSAASLLENMVRQAEWLLKAGPRWIFVPVELLCDRRRLA